MKKPRFPSWLLTVALVLTACTTKPQVPASPEPPAGSDRPPVVDQPAPRTSGQSARPTEPPGWRYLMTTSAELRLVSASPDGRRFFMTTNVLGDRSQDLLVTVGEQIEMVKPSFRHITFATPAHWQADIVELPWGKIALEAGSDRGNEGGGVVSPDLRFAAVPLADGLWLGDVQTGEGRIITSPRPEQWPADMGPRNPLLWVMQPRWSSDSHWIYFQSNRQKPYTPSWWRIALNRGPEEPVVGEVLADDGPVAREVQSGLSVLQRVRTDGFFFRSFSPDGHWAAADKTESPTFRLYNLERPEASITYTGAPGHYAGTGYGSWSPDSGKVIFHTRAVNEVAPAIGVLDLKAGGTTTFYAFPDPKAGRASAVGFVGNDYLLVALRQWNAAMTDVQWPGETQWWLLEKRATGA